MKAPTPHSRGEPETPAAYGPAEGRWRALGVLAVSVLLGMTTWFSASAVVPQLRLEWGLTATAGSLLTISVQLGFVLGALVSAALSIADIVGSRRLLFLGALGAAAVNAGLIFSHGPASALPLRFATGVCLALVYPPSLKVMATWFQRGRGLALGVMVGALTIGSATPHLVIALDGGLGGLSWRVVIAVTSCLTVAGGAIAEWIGRDGPFPFPRAVFDPTQAARAFSNPGVRLASFGYFGHMWELYAMWTWFGAFSLDVLTRAGAVHARRDAAFATFAVIAAGALGCWLGGILADSWGRTRLTSLALALSGACCLLIGRPGLSPRLVFALGLVWGFWVVADSAQFSTILTEVADQSYVGTALTLQLALGFTLTVATIWLVPLLRQAGGWQAAFSSLALGPALGLLAMLRLMRSPIAARIAHGRG